MITLTNPIIVRNLNRLKVQAVHYESNESRGQEWVEVFCEYGFMDDRVFYDYPVPRTGTSLKYFKFENGIHPERPGMMLGRCSECSKWFFLNSGPCDVRDCTGTIEPFPSYNRFRNKIDASVERDVFLAAEKFLTNTPGTEGQTFPDPDDINNVRPLVDGTP
jgi:hypothetical protein